MANDSPQTNTTPTTTAATPTTPTTTTTIYTRNHEWQAAAQSQHNFWQSTHGQILLPYVTFVNYLDRGLSWRERLYTFLTGKVRDRSNER